MDKDEFDKFKFIIELNSLAKNPYSKNKIILYFFGLSITTIQLYLGLSEGKNPAKEV